MKITETKIRSKSVFSDDKEHRLLLHKEWDKQKPSAMIIMINPNSADDLNTDTTTMLVMNNLNRLGYGSVDIVNLYTKITSKIQFRFNSDEDLLHPENDKTIAESAKKSDKIILAWGSIGNHNQRIKDRQKAVLELLKPFSDKLYQIGENGYHPLTPIIRNNWELISYKFEEEENEENSDTGTDSEA